LRINREKVAQSRGEFGRMLDIASNHSGSNVVHKHLADALGTVLLVQQILAKNSGRYLRDMFMFGDGGDLRFRQSTQSNAIFKGNHPERLSGFAKSALRQIKPLPG
jgi:hypothetical protein